MKFCINRASYRRKGVEIFELDPVIEMRFPGFSDRDIHITAQLSFFHIGVRGVYESQEFLQLLEVCQYLVPTAKIRLCHDLHEGTASTIVVDERLSCVDELSGIRLQMHASDPKCLQFRTDEC